MGQRGNGGIVAFTRGLRSARISQRNVKGRKREKYGACEADKGEKLGTKTGGRKENRRTQVGNQQEG